MNDGEKRMIETGRGVKKFGVVIKIWFLQASKTVQSALWQTCTPFRTAPTPLDLTPQNWRCSTRGMYNLIYIIHEVN